MVVSPRPISARTIIELLKHNPRHIPMLLYFAFFGTISLIIVLSVGAVITDDSVPKVNYSKIKGKGTLVNGVIVDKETVFNVTVNDEHPTIITYKYSAGREFVSKQQIFAPDAVSEMKIGNSIPVRYLDDQSILDEYEPYSFPLWIFFTGFAVLFIVIYGANMGPSLIKFKRYLDMYRFGKVASAKLVSLFPKDGGMFRFLGTPIAVTYDYTTPGGKTIRYESITTDRSILSEKRPGDEIKIFVSPADEMQSCVIPKAESKRNNWRIVFS